MWFTGNNSQLPVQQPVRQQLYETPHADNYMMFVLYGPYKERSSFTRLPIGERYNGYRNMR